MDRAGLKVDLSNDFEVRDEANLRFVDRQENIASKLAQLEVVVRQQNIELQIYQKRLGISKEDALNVMDEAQRGLNSAPPFEYLKEEEADSLYGLIRALDERGKNFDAVSESQEKAIDCYKRNLRSITDENALLRSELAAKTREFSDLLNKGASTLHTLEKLQHEQTKEENTLLEEEVNRLHEFLADSNERQATLTQENVELRKLLSENVKPESSIVSKELIDLKYKLKTAEKEVQDLMKQRDKLLLACSDKTAEHEDFLGQIRTLKSQTRGLEDQIEQYNKGDNDLALRTKKKIEEIQRDSDKWKERFNEVGVERHRLATELEECRNQVLDWQEKFLKADTTAQENKKLIDILEEKVRHEKEMQHNLRDQLESYETQMKEVSRREGLLEASEDRYKHLIKQLSTSLENEAKNSSDKYSSLVESIKDKFTLTIQEKDEEIIDLKKRLTLLKIKVDRLEMENSSLRDTQERFSGMAAKQEEKETTIFELNKQLSELQIQNDILARKVREFELKKLHTIQGIATKDEGYRKLEQELMKAKQLADTAKNDANKQIETVRRKERAIQGLEEEKREAIRRTAEMNTMSNQEYLRDLQAKDSELLEQRKRFREMKEEMERKLKQHEDLEEQLVSHSKLAIRGFEQKLMALTEENEGLKHKYRMLESMMN